MKTLIILAGMLISGCASQHVTTTDPDGRNWEIVSKTLFKDITEVNAEVGNVKFSLGNSTSVNPIPNEVIACMLAPALCK